MKAQQILHNSHQININKRDVHDSIPQSPPRPGQRKTRISFNNIIFLPP